MKNLRKGRVLIVPDLSPNQLKGGWANNVDGFYLSTLWWWNPQLEKGIFNRFPPFVERVVKLGGVKKVFGIPEKVIYIAGVDRYIFRHPVQTCIEQICLGGDVLTIQDVSIEQEDSEELVMHKLGWNRGAVDVVSKWVRSKGIEKPLLGIIHGYIVLGDWDESLETYLREADYIKDKVDWIGIPTAPLTKHKHYGFINRLVREVINATDKDVYQLMGGQSLKLVPIAVKIAKDLKKTLILEADTIGRFSRRRRALTFDKGKITFKPIYQMKHRFKDTLDIFNFNVKQYKKIVKTLMDAS